MTSKSKQRKKTAFSFFLEEYAQEQKSKGRKISFRIAAEECAPFWENMPREEREPYLELASINKLQLQREKGSKSNPCGANQAELERQQTEAKNRSERANKEIGLLMQKLDWKQTENQLFFTVHCHYLAKIEETGIYMPGEVAICEFNLISGIKAVYHRLVNSGSLPVGYGLEAKNRRETIHNLPFDPPEDAISSYEQLARETIEVLGKGKSAASGKLPPMYADEEDIPAIENIMQQFWSKMDQPETPRVYPVQKLLYELKNKCAQLAGEGAAGFSALENASTEIEKDTYRYASGISCNYHAKSDRFYHSCSQSIVQRYVYLICDHCCHFLNIRLEPGKHQRILPKFFFSREDSSKKKTTRKKVIYDSESD